MQKGGFTTCTACVNSKVTQPCLQTTVPPGKASREPYPQRASQKLNSAVKPEQDPEIAVPQQHSTAPATSAQLLRGASAAARHPAASHPTAPCGTAGGSLATELAVQRRASRCLPPQPFRRDALLLWSQSPPPQAQSHYAVLWDLAGKWFEVTRQALLTGSHPSDRSYTWRASSPLFLGAANVWTNKSCKTP